MFKETTEYSSAVYRDGPGVASIIVYLRFMVYGTSNTLNAGLWLQASHVVIWRKHVSAAVSELRESNQNKEKNSEIGCLQFNTFPEYIIHPFFNQRYLLSTCIGENLVKTMTEKNPSDVSALGANAFCIWITRFPL